MPNAARRRGSICEVAPGKYRVRVCTGKAGEKYVYHDETIIGKYADARALRNKIARECDTGEYIKPARITLSAWFDDWLKLHRTKVMPRTADWYAQNFNQHARTKLGHFILADLRAEHIEQLLASLHGKRSAITIRAVHRALIAALRHAVKRGLILRNPAEGVELPKVEQKERRVLSPDEARKFLQACNEVKRGLLVEFALLTGMRPEEYLALRWSDYDAKRGVVTVNRVLVQHKGSTTYEKPKTVKSRRSIPLPQSLSSKLHAHRNAQLKEKIRRGKNWQNHDLIFCTRNGTPHQRGNIATSIFHRVLAKAGLPHMRLYDLRHSQATILMAAGEPIKVISERLGHSSSQITLDVYSHVAPGMQERATAKLEELLYGQTG